jgi:hypothetical protein
MKRAAFLASILTTMLTLAACADCPSCSAVRSPSTPEAATGNSDFRLCVANVPITSGEGERACAAVSVRYLLPSE